MGRPSKYPQELKERAVRMVFEHAHEHRILHRIERVVLVPQRRLRNLESLELDAGQKLVQRTGACLGFVRQVHVAV